MDFKYKLFLVIIIIAIFLLYIYFEISKFKVNNVVLFTDKIDKYKEIRIIQMTDFHNNKCINKDKLLKEIKKANSNLIVLTGDIIDDKTKDFSYMFDFLIRLKDINSNIYFVEGNHELRNANRNKFIKGLKSIGINILDNEIANVKLNKLNVNLCGVDFFINKVQFNTVMSKVNENFYTILLSHSPNRPIKYLSGKEDLILSGHTHGGQVRLPIIGAIIAPGQGYFPKYDKGLFEIGNSKLYIDSGLGCSAFPIRFLNRVQISCVTIKGNK